MTDNEIIAAAARPNLTVAEVVELRRATYPGTPTSDAVDAAIARIAALSDLTAAEAFELWHSTGRNTPAEAAVDAATIRIAARPDLTAAEAAELWRVTPEGTPARAAVDAAIIRIAARPDLTAAEAVELRDVTAPGTPTAPRSTRSCRRSRRSSSGRRWGREHMSESLIDKLTKTPEGMRLYQQERAILDATELVCEKMNELGISRDELAKRLGRSVKYVDKLLDGRERISIRKLSDIFVALGFAVHFIAEPLAEPTREQSP